MAGPGDMKLGVESLKGFSGKMVQAVFGFVGTIVFARVLGPTSFGGFYLLLTVVFFANRPVGGVAQAVKKRCSEENRNRSELIGGALAFNALLFGVVTVLAFLLQGRLVEFTRIPEAPLVFAVLFASFGLFSPLNSMLSAEGRVGLQVWNDTLRSVLTLPLQLGFVLLGFGAAGMGYGLAGATFLTAAVVPYLLGVRPSLPSRETVRSLWAFARHSIPQAFVSEVYNRLDIVLIGFFITAGVAGQYEAALKLTVPASFVSVVVTSGMMAKVSNLHSRGEEIATDVSNAAAFVSILAIPLFFGALAIPRAVIVTAFGAEYAAGAALLAGLAAYQVISTQTSVVGQALNALDRPDVTLRIDVVTLALNLVVGIALVQVYGAVGVVWATILAGALRYTLLSAAVVRSVDGVDLLPRALAEQAFAGVVMFAAVELLSRELAVRNWLDLSVLLVTGVAVYGTVLLVVSERVRFTIRAIYADAVSG